MNTFHQFESLLLYQATPMPDIHLGDALKGYSVRGASTAFSEKQ
jgi:hypothetical protein